MKKINVVILIIVVLILFIAISNSLVERTEHQKVVAVVENKIDIEEKESDNISNETNDLLKMERIVVVLPSKQNNEDKIEVEEEKEEVQAEQEEQVESKPVTNNQNNSIPDKKYYIKVNYRANVVTVYTKDDNGEFKVPLKAMVCSTGTATPTSGVYDIKLKWEWLKMFGNVYGYYTTQIVGNILFHSVPYLEKGNPASLEYWEYDKLGTSCSAGCIRLTVADAKWIYNNVEQGTLVEFYSSSDPGPLRKTNSTKNIG